MKFYVKVDQAKRTEHNTIGCQNVQASTLPVLTEENLPNWEELEKTMHKKYMCDLRKTKVT